MKSIFVVSVLFFCVSCASVPHCPEETEPMPKESRFTRIDTKIDGKDYPFWRTNSPGQPILFLHALNGLSPWTMDLALEMESWGFRVYTPSLYGPEIFGEEAYGYNQAIKANKLVLKSPDWNPRALADAGPILEDIREMTRWISQQENGRHDIVVIGNCLTGMFPLAFLDEPHVETVVLAQPATPLKSAPEILLRLPQTPWAASCYGLSESDVDNAFAALQGNPSKGVIGFHYTNDPLASFQKFKRLSRDLEKLGMEDRFETYLLSPKNSRKRFEKGAWTEVGTTIQKRKALFPHSTIINAATCEDRLWYRAKLRDALAGGK